MTKITWPWKYFLPGMFCSRFCSIKQILEASSQTCLGSFLLLCAQGTQAHGVAIAIIPQYDILYHLKMNTGIISDDMMRHRSSWHWTYRWASRKCPSIHALFLHVFWKGVPWPRMGLELWVTGSLSINVGEWSSWSAPSVVVPPPSSHLFGNQSSETGYEYFISLNLSSEYTVKHSHYKSVQIRWTKNISADTVAFSPPMQLIMLKQ